MSSPDVDNILMEELREGKLESLEAIFEKYHTRLYNYFLKLTNDKELSEDLVQEVFVRLLKYRTSFKKKEYFSAWIFKVARHAFIDQLRKKGENSSFQFYNQSLAAVSSHVEPSPHQLIEKAEETSLLNQALSMLPLQKKEVLVLSRFQHFKCREIAEILGLKQETVKVLIHRPSKSFGKFILSYRKEKCHEMHTNYT